MFKKLSCLLVVLMSISAARLQAQPDPSVMKERLEKRSAEILEALELTNEQVEPVRTILAEADKERLKLMEAVREQDDRRQMRTKMMALNADAEAELAMVLTADQMEVYLAMMEKMRSSERRPREGNRRF